jgi:hypothetical protein
MKTPNPTTLEDEKAEPIKDLKLSPPARGVSWVWVFGFGFPPLSSNLDLMVATLGFREAWDSKLNCRLTIQRRLCPNLGI